MNDLFLFSLSSIKTRVGIQENSYVKSPEAGIGSHPPMTKSLVLAIHRRIRKRNEKKYERHYQDDKENVEVEKEGTGNY